MHRVRRVAGSWILRSGIDLPPEAPAAMRSGRRPGARAYGATATRRTPSARRARIASAGVGSAAEANAGRTAHQPVVRRHSRATCAIPAIASGSVEPAAARTMPVVARWAGWTPASSRRRFRAERSRGDGPSTGAWWTRRDGGAEDSAAGMSVLAWNAWVRRSGAATTSRTPEAASQDNAEGTDGPLKSRNASDTRTEGSRAETSSRSSRIVEAWRGSRLPWAIRRSAGRCISSSPAGPDHGGPTAPAD
ncbi:hypothetical protein SRB5_69940 [Streptomyces sp. RB5]|uniref:Uncharacterized protein n=1 Tax=Streptomyces smaragdinus TaxID=2585196 RepID=A0A7K0CTJ5_9ACTN|nr:hypothetical protein [Streptomyces smaragdinus]